MKQLLGLLFVHLILVDACSAVVLNPVRPPGGGGRRRLGRQERSPDYQYYDPGLVEYQYDDAEAAADEKEDEDAGGDEEGDGPDVFKEMMEGLGENLKYFENNLKLAFGDLLERQDFQDLLNDPARIANFFQEEFQVMRRADGN